MTETLTIRLASEDYDLLVHALGIATGACIEDGKQAHAEQLRGLFERIQATVRWDETKNEMMEPP